MASLLITEFTDPGCPFAWSAEPVRRRLSWLYGDQLQWRLRMVGLAQDAQEYEAKGFTPARQSESFRRLSTAHHMPMDTSERPRMAATMPGCLAVVAARLHAPERETALLRALRVAHFSGCLLDDPATHERAASDAGIEPAELRAWMGMADTEEALQEDLRAARDPTPGALALDHKLASWSQGRRYTCPSYEISAGDDGIAMSIPGFQPLGAYEVAIANLAPRLQRRADPEDVGEVLAWAGEPLATIEVATVCDIDLQEARERLGRVASERHLGFEGLWSPIASGALGPHAVDVAPFATGFVGTT